MHKSLNFIFHFWRKLGFSQKLVSYDRIGENSLANINATYGLPIYKNGVEFYKITYETPDDHGVVNTASGLLQRGTN